jgi:HprK-related kinase A
VKSGIALHYAEHELAEATEFADFRVSVRASRRFIAPTVVFQLDGASPFKPLSAQQAFPLFEWGLNWCVAMYCHQYLIIHAAVLEKNGRSLVLPAPPGSGKSTLCAALVARGWRLLSDELALVETERTGICSLPRPISLKNESIATVRTFWPEAAIGPVVHDTMKGSVAHVRPPADSVRFAGAATVPGWIVLPRYRKGEAIQLSPLTRGATFMHLLENAFNYSILGRRGFETLAHLVGSSDCLEFVYGGDLSAATRAFEALSSRP